MYGFEQLKLNTAAISATDHLRLKSEFGTQYKPTYPCWIIGKKGGYFELSYQMATTKSVLLNLTLRSGTHLGKSDCPITITCNGSLITAGFDPGTTSFYSKSWHIPKKKTVTGENIIRITLAKDASTAVMIQNIGIADFEIEEQQQTNWCWCAVGVSISKYYQRIKNNWTQCEVYNKVKGSSDVCSYAFRDPQISSSDNLAGDPGKALSLEGINGGLIRSFASWEDILAEIDKAQPMPCGIIWSNQGGAGHTTVITAAYTVNGQNWLVVDDPWYGRSSILYDKYKTAYKKTGDEWKYTWKSHPT